MNKIEEFLKWFFNQKIIGIDHKNNVLLMGKNGIYIDAYEEYNKEVEIKITNREKLNNMTNEELANFIFNSDRICDYCINAEYSETYEQYMCKDLRLDCSEQIKLWLELECDNNEK